MALIFDSLVNALLDDREVLKAQLVQFNFLSGVKRYWLGAGPLKDGNGVTWQGLGQLLSMSGLEMPIGDSSPMATFSLSGVDVTLLDTVYNSSEEVKNRDVTVFVQFYDAQTSALIGTPVAVYPGVMDTMSHRKTGPSTATITVTAENLFARGANPMAGTLLDQKWLYPTDRGLEHVPKMPHHTAIWPYIRPPDDD